MPTPSFDADRLTRLRRVSAVAPSPDGSWLAVTVSRLDNEDAKYVSDLWRVPLVGDGEPIQLTRGEHSDHTPRFRRDGALLFLSDRKTTDEDEARTQIWMLPAVAGEPRPLTDEPLGVRTFQVARDGDVIAVLADVLPGVPHDEQRARATELAKHGPSHLRYRSWPVRHWDQWLPRAAPHVIAYDTAGKRLRDLTPGADLEYRDYDLSGGFAISDDGTRVALPALTRGADRVFDSALRLIETADGSAVDLGAGDGVTHTSLCFSPDGRRIAAVYHRREPRRCGRPEIRIYDLSRGQGRPLGNWDVWPEVHGWTRDGNAVIATAALNGFEPVFTLDAETGAVTRITSESAGGVHLDLHAIAGDDGADSVVGIRHRMLHPPEPFAVPLRPDAAPRLVANLSGMTPEQGAALATWESFTTTSRDGVAVQSFLMLPANSSGGPPPVLLWIHGGPIGSHVDGWHWRWNPLIPAAAGYAVALPNPRGSTGFGQELIEDIWNNTWGGACFDDLMTVTDALEERDELDGSRIAAMGGSFGGYMANWIGGKTDRFRCLVTHAGLYNLHLFHGTTDYPGYMATEIGATPYEDPAAYDLYSPHRLVSSWKSPTLIIHGEKDYRVPVSEALVLFEALQLHGVEAELLIFPDENHWILRPRNAREWYRSCMEFLDRHMGLEPTPNRS